MRINEALMDEKFAEMHGVDWSKDEMAIFESGIKQGLMIAEILVSCNYDDICRSDDPAAYVNKLIENENKTI